MKRFLFTLFLLGTLTFAWDHDGGDGVKYRLYMGYETGKYVKVLYDGPNKTCTVKVPDGFTLYFAAKAYTTDQESEFSNEVSHNDKITIDLEENNVPNQ